MLTDRVREIVSWYDSETPGTRTNLARLLNHGRLGGTGKLVIYPVDQGFEHGPARSFAPNPPAYDPLYHYELAIESGCNAYAAPLGFLEAGATQYLDAMPRILKLNSHDVLQDEKDPLSAVTGSVQDAVRLGCVGVGFTIYPGSAHRVTLYQQLRELIQEARAASLVVVVWSYPRGRDLSFEDETALDVVAYAAQIAAQLGADIIKVKLPSAAIAQKEARRAYERAAVPTATLAERVRHVVQSAFNGRRIVIFSGGGSKTLEALLDDVRAVRDGGGFGSIIGRNTFQRPKAEALDLLASIMDIYATTPSPPRV